MSRNGNGNGNGNGSKNVHFTANQLRFIEWLAAPKIDRVPMTQKLFSQEWGVSEKTLVRWKKLPGFQGAVTERARELLGDDLPEIYGALRREAIKGGFQHIKLALELTGEHVDRIAPTDPTGTEEYGGGLTNEERMKRIQAILALKQQKSGEN